MCGVAGLLGPTGGTDPDAIRRMVTSMHHRGPDDDGFERILSGGTECWLGNARLAIIDLSAAGHMPMADTASANWITFNGEIYNFPSLRAELEREGEKFASHTDTEVVLSLYRREGAACVRRLRGMFAFAVWDAAKRELFIARDRAGKKPLYYAQPRPNTFVFGSEIRTLLASELIERRLDPRSLEVFLANGFVVSPLTLVRGVLSLLPGHCMRVGADGTILERSAYWRPPHPDVGGRADVADDLEAIHHEFREAVRLRLISDVPLGVFLSGGMDSSAVLGALGPESADLRTFSIAFPEKDYDESEHSRRVATHWKTRHTEVVVGRDEFFRWLPDAMASMDQPTFDGVNTYLVSRAARESGLKVAISGIGADELFGGYPFFRGVPSLDAFSRASAPFAALFRGVARSLTAGESSLTRLSYAWSAIDQLGSPGGGAGGNGARGVGAYQAAQILFPSWSRRRLIHEGGITSTGNGSTAHSGLPAEFIEFLRQDLEGLDPVSATSLLTWRLFLGERCLRDTDTMSMGVSLEVRAPFTDHLLVEKTLRLSGRLRCAGPPDKPFERRALASYLEGAWLPRGKQGFVLPYRHWLAAASTREMMRESLGDAASVGRAGLDGGAVLRLQSAHHEDPARVPWSRIWSIFSLVDWCRRTRVSA
jgi:asparagine synthase (glutamine-hydrolysing)